MATQNTTWFEFSGFIFYNFPKNLLGKKHLKDKMGEYSLVEQKLMLNA